MKKPLVSLESQNHLSSSSSLNIIYRFVITQKSHSEH